MSITEERLTSSRRTTVEGGAKRITDSRRPRSRQKHEKRSNPFSTRGLDIFESVCTELSAKREHIAKKTGAPENLVRFADSMNGWSPVVLRAREGTGKKSRGRDIAGVAVVGPVGDNNGEKHGELTRKHEGRCINGEAENISISVLGERSHSLVMPWSGILTNRSFGVFSLSAISVRRLAVPMAAAMAVGGVMGMKRFIVGGLSYTSMFFRNSANPTTSQIESDVEAIAQKNKNGINELLPNSGLTVTSLLQSYVHPLEFLASMRRSAVPMAVGGVICMKRFISSGVSYSSMLFRNPKTSQTGGGVEAIAPNKKNDIGKLRIITPRPSLTETAIVPRSSLRVYVKPNEFLTSASSKPVKSCVKNKKIGHEHKHHHDDKCKAKAFRLVPMDNRPTRPARAQGSDSLSSRTGVAIGYDDSAGATTMIITVLCLAFCGWLCAIFFISAWWYLLPMCGHHSERKNRNNDRYQ